MIKYGENYVSLDTANPPHVTVEKNVIAYWDINPVPGNPSTYT